MPNITVMYQGEQKHFKDLEEMRKWAGREFMRAHKFARAKDHLDQAQGILMDLGIECEQKVFWELYNDVEGFEEVTEEQLGELGFTQSDLISSGHITGL